MHEIIHIFAEWLMQYGGIILFILLVLGIVGLPIPDETLLVLCGWLVAIGKLDPVSTVIFAITGSICGITTSYYLGRRTSNWVTNKCSSKFHITKEKIEQAHYWYERFGKWTLLIGYFIPVVRHLSGFVAGNMKLSFKEFMLFAYTGALIWSLGFLCLGYFLLIEIIPLESKKEFLSLLIF